jgi:hypothetical protein
MTDIAQILEELAKSADPVDVLRSLVLEQGGFWSNPTEPSGLFEVQFAGLIGIGPSPASAVDDWIMQAHARLKPMSDSST